MIEQLVTVSNRAGVHSRPSAIIAEATQHFSCDIAFSQGSNTINAKSVLGIITLGAVYKSQIKITCDGADEEDAMKTLVRLFETKFEED